MRIYRGPKLTEDFNKLSSEEQTAYISEHCEECEPEYIKVNMTAEEYCRINNLSSIDEVWDRINRKLDGYIKQGRRKELGMAEMASCSQNMQSNK